jgi:hypothetical protein
MIPLVQYSAGIPMVCPEASTVQSGPSRIQDGLDDWPVSSLDCFGSYRRHARLHRDTIPIDQLNTSRVDTAILMEGCAFRLLPNLSVHRRLIGIVLFYLRRFDLFISPLFVFVLHFLWVWRGGD